MDLDARPYRSFIAVADSGSFSRAAASLNVSQPSLSAQIREFERRLNFDLFVRSTRRVALTPEGALFLSAARRIIAEIDWVNRTAREIKANALRIGAAHFTGSIVERQRLIEGFVVANQTIAVQVIGRSPSQLHAELVRRTIDVAIAVEPEADIASNSAVEPFVEEDFERLVVRGHRIGLLVPRRHPLAQAAVVDAADLHGQRILSIGRAHGVALSEAVARAIEALGGEIVRAPESDAASIVRYAALLGLPAIDLGWFVDDATCRALDLVRLRVGGLALRSELVVLCDRRHVLRPAAAKFWSATIALGSEDKEREP